jgi:hypothetical protein
VARLGRACPTPRTGEIWLMSGARASLVPPPLLKLARASSRSSSRFDSHPPHPPSGSPFFGPPRSTRQKHNPCLRQVRPHSKPFCQSIISRSRLAGVQVCVHVRVQFNSGRAGAHSLSPKRLTHTHTPRRTNSFNSLDSTRSLSHKWHKSRVTSKQTNTLDTKRHSTSSNGRSKADTCEPHIH